MNTISCEAIVPLRTRQHLFSPDHRAAARRPRAVPSSPGFSTGVNSPAVLANQVTDLVARVAKQEAAVILDPEIVTAFGIESRVLVHRGDPLVQRIPAIVIDNRRVDRLGSAESEYVGRTAAVVKRLVPGHETRIVPPDPPLQGRSPAHQGDHR